MLPESRRTTRLVQSTVGNVPATYRQRLWCMLTGARRVALEQSPKRRQPHGICLAPRRGQDSLCIRSGRRPVGYPCRLGEPTGRGQRTAGCRRGLGRSECDLSPDRDSSADFHATPNAVAYRDPEYPCDDDRARTARLVPGWPQIRRDRRQERGLQITPGPVILLGLPLPGLPRPVSAAWPRP